MKKIYICFCFLILLSCQTRKPRVWTSSDIIISDQASLKFPEAITPEQAQEDIDFLIYTLSNGYGGRNYLPGNTFSEALQALRKISKVSSLDEFHDNIDEALYLIPDNHLSAYYKGRNSKKRISLNRTGNVGSNNISNPEKVWEVRIDRIGKKNVLYISIKWFPYPESDLWYGFLKSISTKLKKSDSLVLDLRGNRGGHDTKAMEMVELLYGHPFEHPISKQYRSQTPESLALDVNNYKVDIINANTSKREIPDYTFNYLNEATEFYESSINGKVSPEFIRRGKGGGNRSDPVTGYTKPIYILMDADCASSGEFLVASFQWHKYAKTFGENTSGTVHYSNYGIAVLPNSKFKVMIPTQHSEFFDKRFIERTGLTPDVQVSAGEDAYEVVKKIISKK